MSTAAPSYNAGRGSPWARRPALWVVVVAAAVAAGCATNANPDEPDAEARLDAISGVQPTPDTGLPPPLPRLDSGTPAPEQDAAPGGCIAGSPTGVLCEVCGPNGTPVLAADDPGCPAIDCTTLDRYALVDEDGVAVCYKDVHRDPARRCAGRGQCYVAPNQPACGDPDRVQVARADDVCHAFEGCVGATPGTLVEAPQGTPCDDGICTPGGVCDTALVDRCADFESDDPICAGDPTYCEFAVVGPTTCGVYCQEHHGICLPGGRLASAGCVTEGEVGCFDMGDALVCRCRLNTP